MEGPEGKEENYGTLYQMLRGNGGGEAIKHLSICLFLYAIRLTDIPRNKVLLSVAFLKKDENKTNLTIPSKDNNIITQLFNKFSSLPIFITTMSEFLGSKHYNLDVRRNPLQSILCHVPTERDGTRAVLSEEHHPILNGKFPTTIKQGK